MSIKITEQDILELNADVVGTLKPALINALSAIEAIEGKTKPSFMSKFFGKFKVTSDTAKEPPVAKKIDATRGAIDYIDPVEFFQTTQLRESPYMPENAHPVIKQAYNRDAVEAIRSKVNTKSAAAVSSFNKKCEFIDAYAPGLKTVDDVAASVGMSSGGAYTLRKAVFADHTLILAENKKPQPIKTPVAKSPAIASTKTTIELSPVPEPHVTSPETEVLCQVYRRDVLESMRNAALASNDPEEIEKYERCAKFAREYLTGKYFMKPHMMDIMGLKESPAYNEYRRILFDAHTHGRKGTYVGNTATDAVRGPRKSKAAKRAEKRAAKSAKKSKPNVGIRPSNMVRSLDAVVHGMEEKTDNRKTIDDTPRAASRPSPFVRDPIPAQAKAPSAPPTALNAEDKALVLRLLNLLGETQA